MADTGTRRSKVFVVDTPGRDKGRAFRITEMSAIRGEKWAWRAFMEIQRAGGNLPDDFTPGGGWQQLAVAGLQALNGLDWLRVEPLLDELLTCVTRVEDTSRPDIDRMLVDSDVDEITTYVQLRAEAFMIHANFSQDGSKSTSTTAERTTPGPSSASTATSPQSSGPSFHRARRRTPSSPRPSA